LLLLPTLRLSMAMLPLLGSPEGPKTSSISRWAAGLRSSLPALNGLKGLLG
jgi:hypothetical protein